MQYKYGVYRRFQSNLETSFKIAGEWLYISSKELNEYKLNNSFQGTEIQSLIDEETDELLAEKQDIKGLF